MLARLLACANEAFFSKLLSRRHTGNHLNAPHTITQRVPTRFCVALIGASAKVSKPANVGTTKQSRSSDPSGPTRLLPAPAPPRGLDAAGAVSSTLENVHSGLPSVGSQAVLIFVKTATVRLSYTMLCWLSDMCHTSDVWPAGPNELLI